MMMIKEGDEESGIRYLPRAKHEREREKMDG
jgi:hypothetical protein